MQGRWMRSGGAMLLAGALAMAGCSGSDGKPGEVGQPGKDGANGSGSDGATATGAIKLESCGGCHEKTGDMHQALYGQMTDGTATGGTKLVATIDTVTNTDNGDGTFKSVVKFTLTKDGAPYNDPGLANLTQKSYRVTKYDPATRLFDTASAAAYSGLANDAPASGKYSVTAAKVAFNPSASNSFLYLYFADAPVIATTTGHYNLSDNVASVAQAWGTLDYTSTANVSGCEKCHPTPYLKHGYRAGTVTGLNDFVACKACHTDQRVGTDFDWQVLADDPATLAGLPQPLDWTKQPALGVAAKYQYRATVMNDTHMSHAMEFAYPQSMANCATCHEGKLDQILTGANFTLETCKSCHPLTATGGDTSRAPALKDIVPADTHAVFLADPYNFTDQCGTCHSAGGAPSFATIHPGYDRTIHAAGGAKYSAAVTSKVDSATFDAATNKLTVKFSVAGMAANALLSPTVLVSLYGYDTKDFIVSGHNGQADGTSNLEWTEGAKQRSDPTKSSNSDRLSVTPATATAGTTSWTAVADLTLWADRLADGSVKRAEVALLPTLGLDQTKPVQADATKADHNPAIAVKGVSRTFNLATKALVSDGLVYGKTIVDPEKCNTCHDALGTTFHSPSYGSAGVVGCRMCHTPNDGAAHFEMQGRSIDAYVHVIHSFQVMDVSKVDFSNKVAEMRYEHHIESTYPNFTTLNCESCHNPGTYNPPGPSQSLPGVLSASAKNASWNRSMVAVPSLVTGPSSRSCGSCHRAKMINEDNPGELQLFNAHTASYGTQLEAGPGVLDSVVKATVKK